MNTEKFIENARLKHGDKYDYSKVEYINSKKNIIIICKIHGEFPQLPYNHLKGYGCKKCSVITSANMCRSNNEEFIEKAKIKHGDKYDYSKVEYKKSNEHVIIICKEHGEFPQTPGKHLSGGCKKCGGNYNKTTDEFIQEAQKIHGDKYDYSVTEYVKAHKPVKIICKKHGEFQQTPDNHLHGKGCYKCRHKSEGKLYDKLLSIYSTIIFQFKQEWCKNKNCLSFDFCIPEHKIIIEIDGEQHIRDVPHWKSCKEEQYENDKFKQHCANDNGYSVIRILQQDVWNDAYDWCQELCDTIEEIKLLEKVTNRYLCKNSEYDHFNR